MIITVANWKGGVGKTTLAIAIADAFVAHHDADVSIVDLDPQSTASQVLLGEDEYDTRRRNDANLYGLLSNRLHSRRRPRGKGPQLRPLSEFRRDFLHFIKARAEWDLRLYPNSPKLWTLDEEGLDMTKAVNRLLLEEAKGTGVRERIVIVDCPPGHSVSTLAAIRSSRLVLCPMTMDRYAFWGKDLFSDYLKKRAPGVNQRFVVTRYRKSRESTAWLTKLHRECGTEVLRRTGEPIPAVFSERSSVTRRWGMDRRKPRDLRGIYGAECAQQLRDIVKAIVAEFK